MDAEDAEDADEAKEARKAKNELSAYSELEALVILNNLNDIGPSTAKRLIMHCGSPQAVLSEGAAQSPALKGIKGISTKALISLANWPEEESWKRDLSLIKQHEIQLLPYSSPYFPPALKALKDCPLLLYIQGQLPTQPAVAIVGTRNASFYGQEMAYLIAAQLAMNQVTVISGLARGIDTKAHLGALQKGQTVAVIGSGIAHIYPHENEKLAQKIALQGAVISEVPMITPPEKHLFPKRNRIIAALAEALLIIEAPLSSGAMITARLALEQKKALFALPGRADLDSFRGNHLLIKERQAILCENGGDILEHLSLPAVNQSKREEKRGDEQVVLKRNEKKEGAKIIPLEEQLLQTMGQQEASIEELAFKTQLPPSKLSILLMSLVLKQKVEEFPGKIYRKKNAL